MEYQNIKLYRKQIYALALAVLIGTGIFLVNSVQIKLIRMERNCYLDMGIQKVRCSEVITLPRGMAKELIYRVGSTGVGEGYIGDRVQGFMKIDKLSKETTGLPCCLFLTGGDLEDVLWVENSEYLAWNVMLQDRVAQITVKKPGKLF